MRAAGKGADPGQVKGMPGTIRRSADMGHHESGLTPIHKGVIFSPMKKTDSSNAPWFIHSFDKYLQVPAKCQAVFLGSGIQQ